MFLSDAGGAYMPLFGMYAAISQRGRCRHCRSFADIRRRCLGHPGKLRKSRRVSGRRDSSLPQSEIPRCARNDTAWLGMRCGWRIHAAVWHVCGYCAPRTMPSLHVARRHHKTTSAPPREIDGRKRKKEKPQSLWEARLCATSERDSSLCSE